MRNPNLFPEAAASEGDTRDRYSELW